MFLCGVEWRGVNAAPDLGGRAGRGGEDDVVAGGRVLGELQWRGGKGPARLLTKQFRWSTRKIEAEKGRWGVARFCSGENLYGAGIS